MSNFEELEETFFKEKIVRTRLLLMIGVCLAMSTMTAQADITDVFIFPEEPMVIDPITIFVSGVEGSTVSITDSILTIDETAIELDIYLHLGFLQVITPWTHSEDIGTLLMGTYDLTVNTIVELQPVFNDTFFTSFEVVPEPATILLLGMGAVGIIRKNQFKQS